jgi:hypothetical protein
VCKLVRQLFEVRPVSGHEIYSLIQTPPVVTNTRDNIFFITWSSIFIVMRVEIHPFAPMRTAYC